jgi:hypothetical protein
MSEQPMVTRGTAIGSTVGGVAGGALSSDLFSVIWHRSINGEWPAELPATVMTFAGGLVLGAVSLVVYMIYWALESRGVTIPRRMFPVQNKPE